MVETLTYSEIIYLFADKSIPDRAKIFNYDLHPSDEKISVVPLSHKMVVAAMAYLVQHGYIMLEIKDVKKLIFLSGKEVFGRQIKQPETEITGIEKILFDNFNRETKVETAVYYLLNSDESSPWGQIVNISKNSLVGKAWLEIEKQRKNIFSAKRYLCDKGKLSEMTPLYEEVESKLMEFSAEKNIFDMIQKSVKRGMAARKEQSDSDD